MRKKNKYLKRKKIIFDDVFAIKEEKESSEEKASIKEKKVLIKQKEQVKEIDSPNKENKEKELVIKKEIEKEKESPIDKKPSIKAEKTEENIIQKFLNKQMEANNKDKDSDEDPILTQPVTILIYSLDKKETIEYRPNKTIRELINHLNFYNYLSDEDKEKNNFKVYYGLEELKLNDERKIYEIILEKKNKSNENENQSLFRVMIINKKKYLLKNKIKEKIYVTLENFPSFMDLSEQINIFIKKYKKEELKYDIKYKNNCCIVLFLSNEITFSFVSFMTNLKFTNKYYRKIVIKIKFNNSHLLKKNQNLFISQNFLTQNDKSRNNSLLNTINNDSLKINLKKNKINCQKSNSYEHMLIRTEPNQINDYFNNRYSSINNSIPYQQEKIINKIENEKSKQKWITNKGFFSGANTKSFNKYINPYNNKNKLFLSSISNNKEKILCLNVNDI